MDPQLFAMMQKLQEGQEKTQLMLGALKQGQEDQTHHINAVSNNVKQVKQDLEKHADDDGAHGIKTMRRFMGGLVTVMGLILTGIELLHFLVKHGP